MIDTEKTDLLAASCHTDGMRMVHRLSSRRERERVCRIERGVVVVVLFKCDNVSYHIPTALLLCPLAQPCTVTAIVESDEWLCVLSAPLPFLICGVK